MTTTLDRLQRQLEWLEANTVAIHGAILGVAQSWENVRLELARIGAAMRAAGRDSTTEAAVELVVRHLTDLGHHDLAHQVAAATDPTPPEERAEVVEAILQAAGVDLQRIQPGSLCGPSCYGCLHRRGGIHLG